MIEDENANTVNSGMDNSFNWENKQAMKIKDTEEGLILCKLFENLLQFYELDYTLNVFVHEVNTASVIDYESSRILMSQKNRYQHGGQN